MLMNIRRQTEPVATWFRRLPVILLLTSIAPVSVVAQDNLAEAMRPEPELLWHKATVLFPVRVFLPDEFNSGRATPVVIALHGFGSSAERFERIGRAFAEAGFIAAVPDGPYTIPIDTPGRHSTWELSTWTEEYGLGPPLTDDVTIEALSANLTVDNFVPSVLERVQEQYRVEQVYLFGFSLGGVYALISGFHNRDQVDGMIAFGATFDQSFFTMRGDKLEDGSHLRIRLALGQSDPMVPMSNAEQALNAFSDAGYQVTLDKFDGGHTVPDGALKRAVLWLTEQVNSN